MLSRQRPALSRRVRKKEGSVSSPKKNDETAKEDIFWLQSLITDVLVGKGYQGIKDYFQERACYVPQKYDHLLLPQLNKAINKELDHKEFQNVSLLLKCVQRFFLDGLKEAQPMLNKPGLIPKYMVAWLEKTRGFLTQKDLATNPALITTLEDFFDTALIICKTSNKGKKQMLDSFVFCLGFLVTEKNLTHLIQHKALMTLNSILAAVPREERNKFSLLEGTHLFMKELARTLLIVGDYDQQTSLSEALCRLVAKKSRAEFVHEWFDDDLIADTFKEINDRDFDTDCRQFLNQLNSSLGDQTRVYSFPCITAFADDRELQKPKNEKLEKFWVDFNLGSRSIAFYIYSAESELWEPVKLFKESVAEFTVIETEMMKTLVIFLKKPVIISSREVMKMEIRFDLQFNISQVSMKTLGEGNQMLRDQKAVSSDYIAKGAESPEEDFLKLDDHHLKTLPFNGQPESMQTKRIESLSGQSKRVDTSPVTSEHEGFKELQEPLVNTENLGLNCLGSADSPVRDRGNRGTTISFNYRKRLLSDTSEDLSHNSDDSWTMKPKRKSLKSYHNRRKKRDARVMTLLPVSPVKTGGEEGEEKTTPQKQLQKDTSRPEEATAPKISSSNSPWDSTPKTQGQNLYGLLELSCSGPSDGEESIPKVVSAESSMNTIKWKLQTLEDREGISGPSLKDKPEDLDGSAFISTLENITKELHSKYEVLLTETLVDRVHGLLFPGRKLRCRENQLLSRSGMKAPACVTELLTQIHECRLRKLQHFNQHVLQELNLFEEEIQALERLENDVLVLWSWDRLVELVDLPAGCQKQMDTFPTGLIQLSLHEERQSHVYDPITGWNSVSEKVKMVLDVDLGVSRVTHLLRSK